ncbi:MAG TPA: M23 family metallopeptidase [Pyrinomonadaceae bacterium]|nr:M23 family metallopeptidase [Pyrinomonadaceae bacterium]
MSTKDRERRRPRATADEATRASDGPRPRAAARLAARAALTLLVSATAACVVSPAGNSNGDAAQTNAANGAPAAASPSPEVTPSSATPQQGVTPAPAPPRLASTPEGTAANLPASLLVPVAGVRAEDLHDTFSEARSEGRVHNSIDIIAPKGTPVLAAADGTIVKLFQSVKGGTTLYQRGTDGKTIYYYAHLAGYADGLSENQEVRRGDVIGYVGDTGNATPGNYHLHFAVWITEDPKRYWDGVNLNPYPLLTGKKE